MLFSKDIIITFVIILLKLKANHYEKEYRLLSEVNGVRSQKRTVSQYIK